MNATRPVSPRHLRSTGRLVLALLAAPALLGAPSGAQVWEVGNRSLEPRFSPDNSDFFHAQSNFGAGVAIGDFDGDGFADVAVGQPGWGNDGAANGALWLFKTLPERAFAPWVTVTPTPVAGSRVGSAVVTGDFDGDGREEVAFGGWGAPVWDVNAWVDSGKVWIVDWIESGWSMSSLARDVTILEPQDGDEFGRALTVADFNGDSFDDLAVGAPGAGPSGDRNGVVHVFYGALSGLRTDNDQAFPAGVEGGVPGTVAHDQFGRSLAGGDFDGDGYGDLAIGTPLWECTAGSSCGQVHVLWGSSGGLGTAGLQILTHASFPGGAEAGGEDFGEALAAGDFDSAGEACGESPCQDDLAIGVPGHAVDGQLRAGAVLVAMGSGSGLLPQAGFLSQADVIGETPEAEDGFGSSLAADRLHFGLPSFEPWDDLVVGAPGEDAAHSGEGSVQVLFGAATGLGGSAPGQLVATAGLRIVIENGVADEDRWAAAFAIGDLDNDGWGDLVAGVPFKEVDGLASMGAVQVIFGALFADGFEGSGSDLWSATSP